MPPTPESSNQPITWLLFSLLTVVCWGLYGIFLHKGRVGMGDPDNGLFKAFLLVGVAYFLIAVLAPIVMILVRGGSIAFWEYPFEGNQMSLIAGILGAVGAFGVLLAFDAKGSPAVVMSIIFAGAPVVNAVTAIAMHPPAGGIATLRWQFYLGILLAALGGFLVTLYKPNPAAPAKPPAAAVAAPHHASASSHTGQAPRP